MLINNSTEKMSGEQFHQTPQDCFNNLHVSSSFYTVLINAAEVTSEDGDF